MRSGGILEPDSPPGHHSLDPLLHCDGLQVEAGLLCLTISPGNMYIAAGEDAIEDQDSGMGYYGRAGFGGRVLGQGMFWRT